MDPSVPLHIQIVAVCVEGTYIGETLLKSNKTAPGELQLYVHILRLVPIASGPEFNSVYRMFASKAMKSVCALEFQSSSLCFYIK